MPVSVAFSTTGCLMFVVVLPIIFRLKPRRLHDRVGGCRLQAVVGCEKNGSEQAKTLWDGAIGSKRSCFPGLIRPFGPQKDPNKRFQFLSTHIRLQPKSCPDLWLTEPLFEGLHLPDQKEGLSLEFCRSLLGSSSASTTPLGPTLRFTISIYFPDY